MSTSLDLNIVILARKAGQDQLNLPNLHIANKPRHPARMRWNDRLLLFLSIKGNDTLVPERREQLFQRLAQIYYKTPGSVTAALRTSARTLNQFLFDRNLKASGSGQRTYAIFSQLVLREGRLYIAHCGPAQAYLTSKQGTVFISDPQIAGKGLGFDRTSAIYYYQGEINPNDTIIITLQPTVSLNDIQLSDLHGQNLETWQQNLSLLGLQGILLQAKSGSGKTSLIQTKAVAPMQATALKALKVSEASDKLQPGIESHAVPIQKEKSIAQHTEDSSVTTTPEEIKPKDQYRMATPIRDERWEIPEPSPITPVQPRKKQHQGSTTSKFKPPISSTLAQAGLSLIQTIENLTIRSSRAISTILSRILPGDASSGLPSSIMLLIAIAIPLVIVSVATIVYFRSGRTSQFEYLYNQAQAAASQAQALSDPNLQRLSWQNVLLDLNQAEVYQQTTDTIALRNLASQNLDDLNGIKRLNLSPALSTNLPSDTQVSQLANSGNELFILNKTTGGIYRAISTASGYDLDETFQCGPGLPGAANTGSLIDFVLLPRTSQLNATVVAMDTIGNFIYCTTGEELKTVTLTPPPTGLGSLEGFTIADGNLFVLDPNKNAVWIYWKSNLSEEPELFFSETVPKLADVVDFTVSGSDLYLLHENGLLTVCSYSSWGVSPTHCTDPANYIDSRKGRENQVFTPDNPFTQIIATAPPDPSLYLFDPLTQSIYHFSLRQLTFHRQYSPTSDFTPQPSSSTKSTFTVNVENRTIFIASGLQIYQALIP